ncbi:MerR family transcriptional regulator [Actinoalloteichus hymeniacidonis]|uniref:Transcriptional regulator n=1 Tax=Actinoalloteichus hymeniacidonis TaxID=340345 RepID=A0AAC9HT74_9PSEU|nr:MerR family transcriptional regulator [Actinoalloteichus hymeniacidonis]AOS64661.1 putative transcriptional regulator [Actinoalloteichus hymeniacidonis]MBB5907264.1 DNA-binding transcriptional MerR regulator [Actinoalloteichus hymeniacidonis]
MSTRSGRLRPIDLARAAGLSTQQVRNYAEAGILPPNDWTESGYRVFEERHRRALLTYRALLRGHHLAEAQAIMLAIHAGDVPGALTLIDAGHAALHQQRAALVATGRALETTAERGPDAAELPKGDLRIGEVAAFLGVRTSALRVWEAAGLLIPQRAPGTGYRSYTPIDVRDARMIAMLRQSHYPLLQIKPVLDDLRHAGSSEALRAAIANRHEVLTARGRAMLAAAALLHEYLGAAGGVAFEESGEQERRC